MKGLVMVSRELYDFIENGHINYAWMKDELKIEKVRDELYKTVLCQFEHPSVDEYCLYDITVDYFKNITVTKQ